MLPAVARINRKDVIEKHRAEPQYQDLLGVSYAESRVVSIGLERFPAGTVLVAQGSDAVGKDVAEKSELEAFVQSVSSNDHFAATLQKKDMTAPRIDVELQQGKNKSNQANASEYDEDNTHVLAGLGIECSRRDEHRCRQYDRQKNEKPNPSKFSALQYNHGSIVYLLRSEETAIPE